jgi:TolB protein
MILLCWWSKMRVNAVKATFLLVALLVLAFHPSLSEGSRPPQRRIVFVRNSMIWLANLDGTNIRKLVKGEDPNISSDGAKVAFTMLPWGGRNTERYIAVADVATGAMKVFKGTPSDNSFRPVWSPDGSRILFDILVADSWRLGLVDAKGNGFRFVSVPAAGLWSIVWAPDGKSIFCQDLKKIYRFSANGDLINSWEINKIFPHGSLDSFRGLSVSGDGNRLLVDINMKGVSSLKDREGPPRGIWLFDLLSAKARQLTPKNSHPTAASWLSDSELLFVDADKDGKTNSIYRTSIDGWRPRLVIKNAAYASVSRSSP